MAATKSSQPGDMRQRILGESTRLFAARGFEGTSLQALADAVGVRKPSLLYHFDSKEAIRDQVIDDLLNHFRDEIPRRLAAAHGGLDRFASAVSALVEFFREDPDRARLVLREVLDQPRATQERLLTHLQPWVHMVTDYIRMGQQSGHVREDVDPEVYLMQVVMMVLGTVASAPVTGALLDRDEDPRMPRRIDELIRMARVGLFVDRDEEKRSGKG
ncbi:MAG: TetR/AcrR family transcriptional regulator [Myxococcota bacterium]|jgi:AcrR family transcriptional regulator|nr:TetR/AcrR family transcriptional regulator [Myxococcota bacterium]